MSNGTTWLIPPGVIMAWAGASPSGNGNSYLSANWVYCDGTSYQTSQYPNLYLAIGAAFGQTDSQHFNVPDLRGYFLRAVDDSGQNRDPNSSTRTANNPGGYVGDKVGTYEPDCVGQNGLGPNGPAQISPSVPVQASNYDHYDDNFHPGFSMTNIPAGAYYKDEHVVNTSVSGTIQNLGLESRPKNVYVYYVICIGIPI